MISNLLNNAAKYTPANGTLSLTMTVDEQVSVRVADNGIGIEEHLLPHVFELFTQGERTPDRAQGGLGLGLALVRSLAELHGGSATAESRGRGEGSAFTLSLPLWKREPQVQADTQAPTAIVRAAQALRVMVVDDNRDAAETLAAYLECLGHEVRRLQEPAQALAAAREESFDAFVLDIGLPGMDGHALARALRQQPQARSACLIALTGYGSPEDKRQGLQAGFDYYFVKPADLDVLAQCFRRPQ